MTLASPPHTLYLNPKDSPIKMNLCARPAWPLVTHFPEVLFVAVRQDTALGKETQPDLPRFIVCRQTLEPRRKMPIYDSHYQITQTGTR